jgi:hypothetical protein
LGDDNCKKYKKKEQRKAEQRAKIEKVILFGEQKADLQEEARENDQPADKDGRRMNSPHPKKRKRNDREGQKPID